MADLEQNRKGPPDIRTALRVAEAELLAGFDPPMQAELRKVIARRGELYLGADGVEFDEVEDKLRKEFGDDLVRETQAIETRTWQRALPITGQHQTQDLN